MENIEKGEYVRTNKGLITKITDIEIEKYEDGTSEIFIETELNPGYLDYTIEDITKHSKQLTDLIEPGDLCYYKLRDSDKVCKNFAVMNHLGKIQLYFYSLDQLKIIKILTHEKIEVNCYKVGGEDE